MPSLHYNCLLLHLSTIRSLLSFLYLSCFSSYLHSFGGDLSCFSTSSSSLCTLTFLRVIVTRSLSVCLCLTLSLSASLSLSLSLFLSACLYWLYCLFCLSVCRTACLSVSPPPISGRY